MMTRLRISRAQKEDVAKVDPKLSMTYKCDSQKCNLGGVLTQVRESVELKSMGIKQIAEVTVEALDANQQRFCVKESAGYIIQTAGRPCLVLRNEGVPLTEDHRVGFIDATNERRMMFAEASWKRLREANEKKSGWFSWFQ
eukprot:GFYU01009934.1.p1 GENE.GFYU01009934.1~~GFYU01009934.1.p1  ORF type:complete len:141 (+),score=18.68 GFYU01009934.1:91-513(+)